MNDDIFSNKAGENFVKRESLDVSLLQLRFSVLIHIQNFLIFYKYVTIKLSLYKYIGECKKKHFRLNKLIINCYRYLRLGDIADNANCNKS